MTKHSPCRRLVALVLLASSTACTTLQPIAEPSQYIPQKRPSRVFVTRADGGLAVLDAPRLSGDTLTGRFAGTPTPAAITLPEIAQLQARRPAPGRTAMLVGALASGAGLIVYLATRKGFDPDRPPPPFYCEPSCTGY